MTMHTRQWSTSVAVGALLLASSACGGEDVANEKISNESVDNSEDALTAQPLARFGKKCDRLTFSVTRSPEDPARHDVAAWLCRRGSLSNKTFQVLLHPSIYDHTYWDFPYRSTQYSYVEWATAAGFATLNIDALGAGESAHPSSELVGVNVNPYVVHQIITELRGGSRSVDRERLKPKKVVLVGGSLGSATAMLAANAFPEDIDGLVVTSFLHYLGPGWQVAPTLAYPAFLDPNPKFVGLDQGYMTNLPGTRSFNYHLPGADQAVIDVDESLKDAVSITALSEAAATVFTVAASVKVPVLAVVGDHDTLFCADGVCAQKSGVVAAERNFYPNAKRFDTLVVPNTGHILNLHRNAPFAFASIQAWTHINVD